MQWEQHDIMDVDYAKHLVRLLRQHTTMYCETVRELPYHTMLINGAGQLS